MPAAFAARPERGQNGKARGFADKAPWEACDNLSALLPSALHILERVPKCASFLAV